jgi:flagellum-specific peptidoglycan hydrolase FlgJ
MKTTLRYIIIVVLCGFCLFTTQAQTRNRQYEEYIHKYKDIAVEEMKRYRIPASITLAQGLLESGAGKSALSRKSNNHFGIKCGAVPIPIFPY